MGVFEAVPAQFDFPAAEKRVLEFWETRRIYEQSLKQREGGPPFVFYEGPPTANGLPHPGHCLTRVVKDLFPRYKTMCGHYCHRKGGWDTHGLPVEVEVCKELGIHGKDEIERYGLEPFVRKCIESVFRYTQQWEELTRRLGFWINLDEAYVTFHRSYVESVWWALKTLFDRGLLYQGHKVVWWWPQGGTALSAGEVGQGYREVADPSITVRFRVAGEANTSLLAWTTTPWTLPSNVALAVHTDFEYAYVKHKDGETFILAKDLIERTFAGLGVDIAADCEVVKVVRGRELIGLKYEPIFRYAEPTGGKAWEVTDAPFVTLEQGTGIVHIAPAFGEDDYQIAQQKGLGFLQLIAPDGTFVPEATDFAGRFCKEADPDIIRHMKERGVLLKRETVKHEYPFCWRADDEPLIQYARKSWFIRTTEFAQNFLANNQKITWLPEHIRDGRFGNFLESNVDWALSRERYWGTPLPIWQCEKTGHQEAIASFAELLAKPGVAGTEAFEAARAKDASLSEHLQVHKPYIDNVTYQSPKVRSARMRRVPDVIDCWFDSGCMPFAQWGYPHQGADAFKARFPADFISEAIDQTRGWFYTLLAISTMLFGENGSADKAAPGTFAEAFPHPFRNCIVLGLMLGEDGKKLSKSQRNYKEPTYIFDREGADAMRWSLLSAQAPWTSVRFQEDSIAANQREFLIRLYNVYSFFVIYANIDGFDPTTSGAAAPAERNELDRWILGELHATIRDIRAALDHYENYPAAQRLIAFVDALSNWYVRRSRARFWKPDKDTDKRNAYATLWTCLEQLSMLAAPFVPFFAETLYQNLVRRPFGERVPESVHLCDYPEADIALIDADLSLEMATVREIASLGRAARTDAKLKVRQPLARVEVVLADPSHQSWLESHVPLIAEELNVKQVEFVAEADQYVSYTVKANFKSIGPKFGKLAPPIQKALAGADGAALRRSLDETGTATLDVAGQRFELTPDDVQITLNAKSGWAATQGRAAVVVLSTEITPELRLEGVAREFVHEVQACRSEENLRYEARIAIHVHVDAEAGGPLLAALDTFRDYILGETLGAKLVVNGAAPAGARTHERKVEGVAVRIAIPEVTL
ncbi:MAG: isoleucine--tRNA ligase [Phycisphaerae bacterium]|nr:isoleucine--tRNA ligase [Phycisphaerae bacterium]